MEPAVDGGMVTTDSDEVAERIRSLRNHGSRTRYHHDEVGYNSINWMAAIAVGLALLLMFVSLWPAERKKLAAESAA